MLTKSILTPTIINAIQFSAKWHTGQVRKLSQTAYLIHPLHVAADAASFRLPEAVIAAAILHDAVEDTDATIDMVEREFGGDVAFYVTGLTKWWPDAATPAQEREYKQQYYAHIATNEQLINLKLIDRMNNSADMRQNPPSSWSAKYYQKTIEEFGVLLASPHANNGDVLEFFMAEVVRHWLHTKDAFPKVPHPSVLLSQSRFVVPEDVDDVDDNNPDMEWRTRVSDLIHHVEVRE